MELKFDFRNRVCSASGLETEEEEAFKSFLAMLETAGERRMDWEYRWTKSEQTGWPYGPSWVPMSPTVVPYWPCPWPPTPYVYTKTGTRHEGSGTPGS